MARVKRAVNAQKKRRTVLKASKGYRGQRSRLYRKAKEQQLHSLTYAYRDRRARKGEFRKLWISRINAAARSNDMTYNRLMQGLKAAGVEVDDRGYVRVDERLSTTNPRIRAAGDLTGHAQLTHVAGSHGSLAASNAVLGLRRTVDPVVPRVTYTQPEVAAVGVGTAGERDELRVVRLPHDDVDRAVAEGRTDGFTALALDAKGRLVGATVVAPRAGEMLAELTAAVRRGDRPRDLGGVIHPYPAWSDGPWNAALLEVRAELEKPLPQRATRALVRTRRWWSDRRA